MSKKCLLAIALLNSALARADIETPPLFLNFIHSDNQFQLYLSPGCEASRFHWPGQNDSINDIVQTLDQGYSPMSFCVNMTGYTPAISVAPLLANCPSSTNTISPGAYITAIGQRVSFVGCESSLIIPQNNSAIGFGGYAIRFGDGLQQAYSYFDSGGAFLLVLCTQRWKHMETRH